MADGSIPDSNITASTEWTQGIARPARHGRLKGDTYWAAYSIDPNPLIHDQWIQVNLGARRHVTGIVMQGSGHWSQSWVTAYNIEYSDDGASWLTVKYVGQQDDMVSSVFHVRVRTERDIGYRWIWVLEDMCQGLCCKDQVA